jgi:hypothetical protein
MKGVRAGRLDLDHIFKPRLPNQMPKYAFSHRRATDIAHAYEQYSGIHRERDWFSFCHLFSA